MMTMTNYEIAKSYRESGCSKAQIKILAELNSVTPKYIKLILQAEGVLPEVDAVRKPMPAIVDVSVRERIKVLEGLINKAQAQISDCKAEKESLEAWLKDNAAWENLAGV